MNENIEQLLQQEIREQKRTRTGAFHRASRTRKHDVVRTPSESLQGFEKRSVTYPGVLNVTTIGEIQLMEILERIKKGEIPPRADFEVLEFKDGQRAAAELRRLHKNSEILAAWKCSTALVSSFFSKFEVAKTKGRTILVGQAAIEHLNKLRAGKDEVTTPPHQYEPPEPVKESYLINIDREFTTSELVNFIERLGVFVNDPGQTYHVKLTIKDVRVSE